MRLPFYGYYGVTQSFGSNASAYSKFGLAGHNGTDYGLPSGTTVLAAHPGTIRVASDPGGYGTYIEVVASQVKTVYAHLSTVLVSTGSQVVEGQVIAKSGNTGNSTGPHLHFGLKPIPWDNNNGYFGSVDPQPYLSKGDTMDYKDKALVSSGDNGLLRIAHSEIGGWDFSGTHAGKYDQQFLASWVGKPVKDMIWAQWTAANAEAFRNRRVTAMAEYDGLKARVKQLETLVAAGGLPANYKAVTIYLPE